VRAVDPATSKEPDSFSKADFGVRSIKRAYGWVNFAEYAELEKISVEEVKGRSGRGELGRVEKHPTSNDDIVIWPKIMCGSPKADALALGMSNWVVQRRMPRVVGIEFDVDNERSIDQARSNLVYLGRELGKSEEIYSEAQELFYRGSFLNLWSSFELFIKDSFGDLVRRFPQSLALLPDWKKLTIVYSDLVNQTDGLQDFVTSRVVNQRRNGKGRNGR
jgi:hypothetical protein